MGIEIDVKANAESAKRDLAEINRNIAELVRNSRNFQGIAPSGRQFSGLNTAVGATTRSLAAMGSTGKSSMDVITSSARGTAKVLTTLQRLTIGIGSAYLGLKSANIFHSWSDELTNVNNRLSLIFDTHEKVISQQRKLFSLARKTRGELSSLASTYVDFQKSLERAPNMSEGRLLRVIETLSKANRLSGSSPEAIKAAMVQLNQGIASGTLRGEELNSVLEQSKFLGFQLMKQLDMNAGQLRKFAEEGRLTTEILVGVLDKMADETDEAFNRTASTVSNALIAVRQAMGYYFADINHYINTSENFARKVNKLAGFFAEASTGAIVAIYKFRTDFRDEIEILRKLSGVDILQRVSLKLEVMKGDVGLRDKIKAFAKEFIDTWKRELEGTQLQRTFSVFIDTFATFGHTLRRIMPVILTPLSTAKKNIREQLGGVYAESVFFSHKVVIPLTRRLESLAEKISFFSFGDERLERAAVNLFKSKSFDEALTNLEELNRIRRLWRKGDKGFLVNLGLQDLRESFYIIDDTLIRFGLLEQRLGAFRQTRTNRQVEALNRTALAIRRVYDDLLHPRLRVAAIKAVLLVDRFLSGIRRALRRHFTYEIGIELGRGLAVALSSAFKAISALLSKLFSASSGSSLLSNMLRGLGSAIKVFLVYVMGIIDGFSLQLLNILPSAIIGKFVNSVLGVIKLVNAALRDGFTIWETPTLKISMASFWDFGTWNEKLDWAKNSVVSLFNTIGRIPGEGLAKASSSINDFGGNVKNVFKDVYEKVVGNSYWPDTINGVVVYTRSLMSRVAGDMHAFNAMVVDSLSAFKENLSPSMSNFLRAVMHISITLKSFYALSLIFPAQIAGIFAAFSGIFLAAPLIALAGALALAATNLGVFGLSATKFMALDAFNKMPEGIKNLLSKVRSVFGDLKEAIVGNSYWPDTLADVDKSTDILGSIQAKVQSFGRNVTGIFKGIYENFQTGEGGPITQEIRLVFSSFDFSGFIGSLESSLFKGILATLMMVFGNSYLRFISGAYFLEVFNVSLNEAIQAARPALTEIASWLITDFGEALFYSILNSFDMLVEVLPQIIKDLVGKVTPEFVKTILGPFEFLFDALSNFSFFANPVILAMVTMAAAASVLSKSFRGLATGFLFGTTSKERRTANAARRTGGALEWMGIGGRRGGAVTGSTSSQKATAKAVSEAAFNRKMIGAAGGAILATSLLDSVSIWAASIAALPALLYAALGPKISGPLVRGGVFLFDNVAVRIAKGAANAFSKIPENVAKGVNPNVFPSIHKWGIARQAEKVSELYPRWGNSFIRPTDSPFMRNGALGMPSRDPLTGGIVERGAKSRFRKQGVGRMFSFGAMRNDAMKLITNFSRNTGSAKKMSLYDMFFKDDKGGTTKLSAETRVFNRKLRSFFSSTKALSMGVIDFFASIPAAISRSWASMWQLFGKLASHLMITIKLILQSKVALAGIAAVAVIAFSNTADASGGFNSQVSELGETIANNVTAISMWVAALMGVGVVLRTLQHKKIGEKLFEDFRTGAKKPMLSRSKEYTEMINKEVAGGLLPRTLQAESKLHSRAVRKEFRDWKAAQKLSSGTTPSLADQQKWREIKTANLLKEAERDDIARATRNADRRVLMENRVASAPNSRRAGGRAMAHSVRGLFDNIIPDGLIDTYKPKLARAMNKIVDPMLVGNLSRELKSAGRNFASAAIGQDTFKNIGRGFGSLSFAAANFLSIILTSSVKLPLFFAGVARGLLSSTKLTGAWNTALTILGATWKGLGAVALFSLKVIKTALMGIIAVFAPFLATISAVGAVGALGVGLFGPGDTFFENLSWAYDKVRSIIGLAPKTSAGRRLDIKKLIGEDFTMFGIDADFSDALDNIKYKDLTTKQFKQFKATSERTKETLSRIQQETFETGFLDERQRKEMEKAISTQNLVASRLPSIDTTDLESQLNGLLDRVSEVAEPTVWDSVRRNFNKFTYYIDKATAGIMGFGSILDGASKGLRDATFKGASEWLGDIKTRLEEKVDENRKFSVVGPNSALPTSYIDRSRGEPQYKFNSELAGTLAFVDKYVRNVKENLVPLLPHLTDKKSADQLQDFVSRQAVLGTIGAALREWESRGDTPMGEGGYAKGHPRAREAVEDAWREVRVSQFMESFHDEDSLLNASNLWEGLYGLVDSIDLRPFSKEIREFGDTIRFRRELSSDGFKLPKTLRPLGTEKEWGDVIGVFEENTEAGISALVEFLTRKLKYDDLDKGLKREAEALLAELKATQVLPSSGVLRPFALQDAETLTYTEMARELTNELDRLIGPRGVLPTQEDSLKERAGWTERVNSLNEGMTKLGTLISEQLGIDLGDTVEFFGSAELAEVADEGLKLSEEYFTGLSEKVRDLVKSLGSVNDGGFLQSAAERRGVLSAIRAIKTEAKELNEYLNAVPQFSTWLPKMSEMLGDLIPSESFANSLFSTPDKSFLKPQFEELNKLQNVVASMVSEMTHLTYDEDGNAIGVAKIEEKDFEDYKKALDDVIDKQIEIANRMGSSITFSDLAANIAAAGGETLTLAEYLSYTKDQLEALAAGYKEVKIANVNANRVFDTEPERVAASRRPEDVSNGVFGGRLILQADNLKSALTDGDMGGVLKMMSDVFNKEIPEGLLKSSESLQKYTSLQVALNYLTAALPNIIGETRVATEQSIEAIKKLMDELLNDVKEVFTFDNMLSNLSSGGINVTPLAFSALGEAQRVELLDTSRAIAKLDKELADMDAGGALEKVRERLTKLKDAQSALIETLYNTGEGLVEVLGRIGIEGMSLNRVSVEALKDIIAIDKQMEALRLTINTMSFDNDSFDDFVAKMRELSKLEFGRIRKVEDLLETLDDRMGRVNNVFGSSLESLDFALLEKGFASTTANMAKELERKIQDGMRDGAVDGVPIDEFLRKLGPLSRFGKMLDFISDVSKSMSSALYEGFTTAFDRIKGRFGEMSELTFALLPLERRRAMGTEARNSELIDKLLDLPGLTQERVDEMVSAMVSGGNLEDIVGSIKSDLVLALEANTEATWASVGANGGPSAPAMSSGLVPPEELDFTELFRRRLFDDWVALENNIADIKASPSRMLGTSRLASLADVSIEDDTQRRISKSQREMLDLHLIDIARYNEILKDPELGDSLRLSFENLKHSATEAVEELAEIVNYIPEKITEIVNTLTESVNSALTEGLKGLLKGEKDEGRGYIETFLYGVMDDITGAIVDAFVEGMMLRITGPEGKLTELGENLGKGLMDAILGEESEEGTRADGGGLLGRIFGGGEEGGLLGRLFGGGKKDEKGLGIDLPGVEEEGGGFFQTLLNPIKDAFASVFSDGGLLETIGGGLSDIFHAVFSGDFLKSAFSIFKSILSFIPGFSTGGTVMGPAGHDVIPAMLTKDEFVVRASRARMFAPLLHQINYGALNGFNDGGFVGSTPVFNSAELPAVEGHGEVTQNFYITGDVSRQTRSEMMKMMPLIANGVNSVNKERGYKG